MIKSQILPKEVIFGNSALRASPLGENPAIILHGGSSASLEGADILRLKVNSSSIIEPASMLNNQGDFEALVLDLSKSKFSQIIGIGGGTVLDKSKKLRGMLIEKGLATDLLVVPTLPGSGVESSKAVVISENRKKIETSNHFIPDKVIYDYKLIALAGIERLKVGSCDAVIHGFESLLSAFLTPLSSIYAIGVLEKFHQISKLLLTAEDSQNLSRKLIPEFCSLSFTGGAAQSETGSGPIHAISHALEAKFGCQHAYIVQRVSRLLIPLISHNFPKLANQEISTRLVNDINVMTDADEQIWPLLISDLTANDLIRAAKLDPCWKATKARVDDQTLSSFLVKGI